MTDNNHPITPPPELVEQWYKEWTARLAISKVIHVATQAARWGADQELEACCKAFEDIWDQEDVVTLTDVLRGIRAARRPKPPSLKEQALDSWDRLRNEAWCQEIDSDLDFIRRALESLPD